MNKFFFEKIIVKQNEILQEIKNSILNRKSKLFTYFNQHCFNIAIKEEKYKDLIENNFNVFLDGIGIYYALKYLGKSNVEKFNATDINNKILSFLANNNLQTYIIGGKFDPNFISNYFHSRGIKIADYLNGYLPINIILSKLDIEKINNSDVIIIGMGVPKQEYLAKLISEKFSIPILCVGNFLEFYTRRIKRAPDYLQNSGLEWIYRIYQEPKRLFKRYFFGIPLFIYNVILLIIKKQL